MTVEIVQEMLFWCSVINLGMLLWWFLLFAMAHDWMYRLHAKWFEISPTQFDTIHYAGMAFFKLSIFLLNLVPYFALHIAN